MELFQLPYMEIHRQVLFIFLNPRQDGDAINGIIFDVFRSQNNERQRYEESTVKFKLFQINFQKYWTNKI